MLTAPRSRLTGSIQLTEGPQGLRKKKNKRGKRSELSRAERIAKGVRQRKRAAGEEVSSSDEDKEGVFESAPTECGEEVEEEEEEESEATTDPEAAESLTRSEQEEEVKEDKVKEELDVDLPDWDPLDLVEEVDVEQLYQEEELVADSTAPVKGKKEKKKKGNKKKRKAEEKEITVSGDFGELTVTERDLRAIQRLQNDDLDSEERRTGAIKDKKVQEIARPSAKAKAPTPKATARGKPGLSLTGSALEKFNEAQKKIDQSYKTGDRFARFQARQLRVKALLSKVRGSVRESIADTLSSNCSTCKGRKDKATAAAVKFASRLIQKRKAKQGTSSSSKGEK